MSLRAVPRPGAKAAEWESYVTARLLEEPDHGPTYWQPIFARQLNAIMAFLERIADKEG